ncbi:MAG: DUF58 domain-containing protein [Lachnospiraceae bacterium]|nr:DUF58 domain-containing protein [Lachnospiraceae bacterium]
MLAAFFILIFALYCSGRVGWFLLLVLVLTPLLSVLLAYLAKNSLEFEASLSHDLMSKGEHCTLNISLHNKGFLPCPPVTVNLTAQPGVTASDPGEICLSVLPKSTSRTSVTFTARLAGGTMTGVDSVTLSDWFGICSARLDKDGQFIFRTGVIPDIIRLNTATDLLLSVHDAFAADKNDETVDETAVFSGGFPGYEYREYRPGDPLKRINSKLSAKKDKLMVRLDERQASSNTTLILDPFMSTHDPQLAQAVLEETLGLILTLINLDLSVTFYYMDDDKWLHEKIFSEDSLILLSRKLAYHIFLCGDAPDLPEKDPDDHQGMIICQAEKSSKTTLGLSGEGIHIYSVSSGEWRHL